MTQSIPNPIAGRNTHRRRGSALMVALALLMLLAVFAALFLTSSRFDQDAATANIDYIRMDLYAEGVAQYVQSCMVYGLWGFDDKPLNYDEEGTYPNYVRTPIPGVTPASGGPGPDAPYDYPGEVVIDPDRSIANGTGRSGDETFFYPDFWLTDTSLRLDLATGKQQVFRHAAFSPVPASEVPFNDLGYSDATAANHWALQQQYADLDGDGHADTPWQFVKPIGNGLYIRAAVRVEDTSGRVNLNVANQPLFVDAATGTDSSFPYFWNAEKAQRSTVYPGYPLLGGVPNAGASTSVFPFISANNPSPASAQEEALGRFRSEMDLVGLVQSGSRVGDLNGANTASTVAGRYGKKAIWNPATYTWSNPTPDARYSRPTSPPLLLSPELRDLLGDPGDPALINPNDHVTAGFPGRFGDYLAPAPWTRPVAPMPVPPQPLPAATTDTWITYDPDGMVRRLGAPLNVTPYAEDQDRPFGTDEAFDLMSLHGLAAVPVTPATVPPTYLQQYRTGGSLPTTTRLEALWPFLRQASADIQYRRLFTTYSWTLDLCPYGEDPYWAAGAAPNAAHTYRKVDINTCTGAEFEQAFEAARKHLIATTAAVPAGDELASLVANLLTYRRRPMARTELLNYLHWRQFNPGKLPAAAGFVHSEQLEWDEQAWQNHVLSVMAPGGVFNTTMETDYLKPGGLWETQHSTNAAYFDRVLTRVSPNSSVHYAGSGGGANGVNRAPFITEVYANITKYDPQPGQTEWDAWKNAGANYFAVELYNPYSEPISIEQYRLVINSSISGNPYVLDLDFWQNNFNTAIAAADKNTVIPPYGYLVITNQPGSPLAWISPNAVLFYHPDLVVFPESRVMLLAPTIDTAGAKLAYAIMDDLPESGNTITWPVPPINNWEYDVARFDLNGGFWLQGNNNAWAKAEGSTGAGLNLGMGLGRSNGLAPPVPFYSAPAFAKMGSASFLSPADVALLLRAGPDDYHIDPTGLRSITTKMDQAYPADDLRVALFNRRYLPVGSVTDANSIADQSGGQKYSVFMQSLMDFITVGSFANDGVDNDGNGLVDVVGAGAGATVDPGELRVPGRVNVNTVSDAFLYLDSLQRSLLVNIDPLDVPTDRTFWQTLLTYRDLGGVYSDPVKGRSAAVVPGGLPNYLTYPGIFCLGDLCNLQDLNVPGFGGFWQTYGSLNIGPLLPAQHMRRFARNANNLTTRSDTYMVTVRVEIVRPFPDASNPTRIDSFGQREYMYLVDRSYCTRPPQQLPAGIGAWGGATNPYFNGQVHTDGAVPPKPDFIPPRVWRMSIPSYAAH